MENDPNPNHLYLLSQLCEILQNPDMPAAFQQFNDWEKTLTLKESESQVLPESKEPSLLQRMHVPISSNNWKKQSNLSEGVESLKRPRSPLSYESLETNPMSHSLNLKRRRHSIPISQKSSLSNQFSMNPEHQENQTHLMSTFPKTPTRISPREISGEPMNRMDQTTKTKEKIVSRRKDFVNPTCLGTPTLQNHPSTLSTPAAKKHVNYYELTTATSPKPNSLSKSPLILHPEFLHLNGNESSKAIQSTSTKSSRHSTILSLMKRERDAWETRRSLLESLNPRSASPVQPSGLLPGEEHLKPSALLSLTDEKNFSTTVITSNQNSQPNSLPLTTNSYSTTSLSATKLPEDSISFSPTSTNSVDYTPQSSCQTESNPFKNPHSARNLQDHPKQVENLKSATSSMLGNVKTQTRNANIAISANFAKNPDTVKEPVPTPRASELYGLQPKYLRYNLWEKGTSLSPTTAEWSENALPLPRPSLKETSNPIINQTIADLPHIFQVLTPIKIDVFESLLKTHPNQTFVKSVCTGLREGFWPWADTMNEDFPVTHDASRDMPTDESHASFIREQCLKERHKGYFSDTFGSNLLLGMYSMPIHAVPKPHSTDLRLVNDHSAGPFSLNNMIDHSQVTGFPLDNMRHLGEMLFDIRKKDKDIELNLWKSNIADTYRILPMHPLWQIKQVITVDSQRYIDRNLCFGSSGSPGIFISFNSLVAWIAKYVKHIPYLLGYMDDSSGCNRKGDILFYRPYGKYFPVDQCRLLLLWDELGIPHKPHKQIFGSPLTIIGIDVNPNLMTMTLPEESKEHLLSELRFWASKPPKSSSGSFKLKYWERLAGWFNWALNVYPLLRPALNNVYAKIAGKRIIDQRVYINNAIRNDLMWAITHIESSSGVQLFHSLSWNPSSADFIIYCDACPEGMCFWYPISKDGYYAPTPVNAPTDAIFFFEALCVLSAILNVQSKAPKNAKILIYTDNTNTVDIFRSLRCLPVYNALLKSAVDVLIDNNYSLRVLHVPGEENTIADALSRVQFSVALSLEPNLKLSSFNPPGEVGSKI